MNVFSERLTLARESIILFAACQHTKVANFLFLEIAMSKLPERIELLRKQNGWTKLELSSRSGINDTLLGRYERGESEPGASNLISLSETLGVSVDYLLGLVDDPKAIVVKEQSPEAFQAAQMIDNYPDRGVRRALVKILEQSVSLVIKIAQNEPIPESDK